MSTWSTTSRPGCLPISVMRARNGSASAPFSAWTSVRKASSSSWRTASPKVLGAGVHIAEGATVIGSVVHDGARVGPQVRVVRSIVGAGAVIGAKATIRDESIVGADTVLEPGSELVDTRVPGAKAVPAPS